MTTTKASGEISSRSEAERLPKHTATPRTLALTLKHQAAVEKGAAGETVANVLNALDEFIKLGAALETENASLIAALEAIYACVSVIRESHRSKVETEVCDRARAALTKGKA